MEDIGYILSEVPFLALIIGFAIKLVSWRRARANRPSFSDHDRRALFEAAPYGPEHWQFYPPFLLAVIGVLAAGLLQFRDLIGRNIRLSPPSADLFVQAVPCAVG